MPHADSLSWYRLISASCRTVLKAARATAAISIPIDKVDESKHCETTLPRFIDFSDGNAFSIGWLRRWHARRGWFHRGNGTGEPTGISPGPTGTSPGPTGTFPGPTGISPGPTGTSPGATGISPGADDLGVCNLCCFNHGHGP